MRTIDYIYRFDPKSGQTTVLANLPAKRCTATSLLDRERQIWWCNLEAGTGNALWALDLRTGKPVFQAEDGSMGFNRNFALARDGSIIFNGKDALWKYDPAKKSLGTFSVPASGAGGLSFLGVAFKNGQVVDRVVITTGNTILGPNNGGGVNVVAMDDFIYAEPQAAPEPASLLLLGSGLVGLLWGIKRPAAST